MTVVRVPYTGEQGDRMRRAAEAAMMAVGFVVACGLSVSIVAAVAWGWAADVLDD